MHSCVIRILSSVLSFGYLKLIKYFLLFADKRSCPGKGCAVRKQNASSFFSLESYLKEIVHMNVNLMPGVIREASRIHHPLQLIVFISQIDAAFHQRFEVGEIEGPSLHATHMKTGFASVVHCDIILCKFY